MDRTSGALENFVCDALLYVCLCVCKTVDKRRKIEVTLSALTYVAGWLAGHAVGQHLKLGNGFTYVFSGAQPVV